ncbi:GNAT family N-acetyltransferase [Aquimarina sp. MMG016]|uniref:GNAT family N-acetyltransferase n=1 Tax=Aquimarina sp. MMG016 TaxID=2822690 RepID=UPI001B39DF89|nr:GNAT family N-acetyltransferase [Aquimarina sp. MMG016]MBQ4819182.1 GNAT family N-acetyltransferase [Aquimarina sp. MMG016]
MISLSRAKIEDAENISYLGATTFDQSFGYLFRDREDIEGYLRKTFSLEKITQSIQKSHNIYWLVKEDDSPIGYAKLQLDSPSDFIKNDKTCKLQKLYMLKGTSSKGIGSRLQQLIFDKAIEEGQEYLWLSALKQNERAIAFYKRNDYLIVGEHPYSIGKEDFEFWVMGRKLI